MLFVATTIRSRGIPLDQPPITLRALLDNEIAFETWYHNAMPRVYAYLYSRCGADAALAEELTQLAFVEAVRHPDGWSGRADLVTWVISIGRHKLADDFRRRGREERRQAHLVERAALADGSATLSPHDLDIEIALEALAPDQRLALTLRAADGLSIRAIARVIGRSEDATESLVRRARAAFRRSYGDRTS